MMMHKGLNQLLCAATVNRRFRETLLRDPAQAIAAGYLNHTFSLTPEEQKLVTSIRAQRLEDFAAQVYFWITQNGNGHKRGLPAGASDEFGLRPRIPCPDRRFEDALGTRPLDALAA